jgi:hypothetical protein
MILDHSTSHSNSCNFIASCLFLLLLSFQAKAVFSTSLEHFYNPKDLVVSGPAEPISREAVRAIYDQIKKADKPLL